jgi:N-acetylneuraminic acid mutarotase
MLDSIDNGSNSTKLYRYDLNSNSWAVVDISGPGLDYIQGNGQCVYKDILYSIQGYHTYSGKRLKEIYSVNLKDDKKVWEEIQFSQPYEDRAAFGYICKGSTVYIFGGYDGKENTNKLIKIQLSTYELNFNSLSESLTVPTARYGHAMEVYDEKLYILGGKDVKGNDLIDFYTFDLKTETWSTLTTKSTQNPSPRSEFAHARVGEILIIYGGVSNNILLGDMHYFNLRTLEWRAVEVKSTNNPINRKGSCMAAAGDTIFIFGGITNQGYSNELWIFDTGKSTYILLKSLGDIPMKTARGDCKAYIEGNGDIIFESYLGETVGRTGLSGIYKYNLSTSIWTSIKPHQEDDLRASKSASLYIGDKMLVAGGTITNFFCKNEIYIYDINTRTINKLDQTLPHMTYNAASVFYKNKLYIHGGGASFLRFPLHEIPINNLIVIDFEDKCDNEKDICYSKCSYGTYSKNNKCVPCPVGSYQDEIGSYECKKCSSGFYSDTEGADSYSFCKPCSQGTFNSQSGERMCYDCPLGHECSNSKVESGYQSLKNFNSLQPDIYYTNEEISALYSKYFSIALFIASSIVIALLLSFDRTRYFIKSLDLYQMRHNYEINKPVIKRKTLFGGVFSLIFIFVGLSIVFTNSLSMILDNISETKALVPLVALNEKYENVIYI